MIGAPNINCEALLDELENLAESWRLTEKYDPAYFPGIREPRLDGNDCSRELKELLKYYRKQLETPDESERI